MKKTFIKRHSPSDQMSLQITSMADVFMILLVFLLKSYGSGVMELTNSKGLTMPRASAAAGSADALKVEISENGIALEGKSVVQMKNYVFDSKEFTSSGSSKALSEALAVERKKQIQIAKTNSGVKLDPRIIVVADQRVPYSTVKAVLASAAVNGYTDFKLAVVQTN
jgi:biopolymer transport protein ExbD